MDSGRKKEDARRELDKAKERLLQAAAEAQKHDGSKRQLR